VGLAVVAGGLGVLAGVLIDATSDGPGPTAPPTEIVILPPTPDPTRTV
jgi:hypothetical protein